MRRELLPSGEVAASACLRSPPLWWRSLFWTLLSAWLTSIILATISFFLSMGFGIIGLFAGSLEGFTKFSLSLAQLAGLFFVSLFLLIVLFVIRSLIRAQFTNATRAERVLGFVIGVATGAIVMTTIALSILGHR